MAHLEDKATHREELSTVRRILHAVAVGMARGGGEC